MKNTISLTLLVLALSLLNATSVKATSLVNGITIPGDATDLSGLTPSGVNTDRLGFISDLYYDRNNNVYYALADRGPGGGVISYNTRVQKFTLDVDPNTGAISNFQLLQTIQFKNNSDNYNGLNPQILNGSKSILGLSYDPEGFTIAPNGNFYVSDEYGPSVNEFNNNGDFIRSFTTPNNLIPRESDNTINYVDGRPTITQGRQDNRGFEGLAMSPDGSKLYAMLQDPLVNEGNNPNNGNADGRYSRNIRITEFSTATGLSTAQYIYQLEDFTQINARLSSNLFNANNQGRNIGISSIIPLNNTEFLVLERDNRGIGVETPTTASALPVGSKRVYKIDLTGATNVAGISLNNTNTLPNGVNPVLKAATPLVDLASLISGAGQLIPEKIEGIAIGPRLNDGSYVILAGTDNDFSVTQNSSNTQFNVCTNLVNTSSQIALSDTCPSGQSLITTFLYSFKVSSQDLGNFIPPVIVPEPDALTSLGGIAILGLGASVKRKLGKKKKA